MGLDRATLDQLRNLLRPLVTRVANTVARGVVQLVDDSTKLQRLQVGVLPGETVDGRGGGAEHFQPYGLASVPLAGAEHVVVFPNGDRDHPLIVVVSDRRFRPTGGAPGTVTLHQHTGAKITLTASGDIEVQPAPGHEVLIRDAAGSVDRLVKRSEFLTHGHATAGTGTPSAPITATALPDTGQFPGTQRLRVQ